jgi:phytoene dehydrogenase-like protein
MRIAIVGAGISGLAAAHLLQREHEITVFEAGSVPRGHANTVRVDAEHATHHVDTGFIVFNDRNYPNFERLLGALGLASQPSVMSFGVSHGGDFEYDPRRRRRAPRLRLRIAAGDRRGPRPARVEGHVRDDIAAHYDLGNDLFELMLDPTMTYSGATFARRDMTLEDASRAKLDRICDKLDLQPSDHVPPDGFVVVVEFVDDNAARGARVAGSWAARR